MADENYNQNNQNEQNGQYYDPQQNNQANQYYPPQQDNNQYGGSVPPQDYNQYNSNVPPQGYNQYGNNVPPQGYNQYGGNVPPQGYNQYGSNVPPQGSYQYNGNIPPVEEKANVGLAILSFFIPIVGLVLYLTQKKDKPKTAKACGKCALASFIIYIVFCVLLAIFSAVVAKKAIEDPDFSSYLDDLEDYDYYDYGYDFDADEEATDNNSVSENDNAVSELGDSKQGYITAPDDGVWTDFYNVDYNPDSMLGYTNGSEIITMCYYDGTGYSKDDIISSVTSSLDNVIENRDYESVNEKEQTYSYSDFYGESAYSVDNDGYQLFTMFFQSDKTSDMIYLAVESPDMNDDEFENLVNKVVNSHSFVNHQLDFKIN